MKCLLAAAALDNEHPKVHEQIVRFKLAIDEDGKALPAQSAEVIKSEFTLLPSSGKLSDFNEDYLSKRKDSVKHTLSALTVRRLLSPASTSDVEKSVAELIKKPSITFEEAKDGLKLLESWKSGEVESYRSSASSKWPKAQIFESKDISLAVR